MKYISYILKGHPINPEELGVVAIPAAFVAIPVLMWFLGGAAIMDGGRILKLKYLLYQREQRRVRYYKGVMVSLGHRADEWKLLAA